MASASASGAPARSSGPGPASPAPGAPVAATLELPPETMREIREAFGRIERREAGRLAAARREEAERLAEAARRPAGAPVREGGAGEGAAARSAGEEGSDDDIFADAGVDYECDVGGAPLPSVPPHRAAPGLGGGESDSDDAPATGLRGKLRPLSGVSRPRTEYDHDAGDDGADGDDDDDARAGRRKRDRGPDGHGGGAAGKRARKRESRRLDRDTREVRRLMERRRDEQRE